MKLVATILALVLVTTFASAAKPTAAELDNIDVSAFHAFRHAGLPIPYCKPIGPKENTKDVWQWEFHADINASGNSICNDVHQLCNGNPNAALCKFPKLCHAKHLLAVPRGISYSQEDCYKSAAILAANLTFDERPTNTAMQLDKARRIIETEEYARIHEKLNSHTFKKFLFWGMQNIKKTVDDDRLGPLLELGFKREKAPIYFKDVFNYVMSVARRIDELFPTGVPFLVAGFEGFYEMTAEQVLCLHANMLFHAIGGRRIEGYKNRSTFYELINLDFPIKFKPGEGNQVAFDFLACHLTYWKQMYKWSIDPVKAEQEITKRKIIFGRQSGYGVDFANSTKKLISIDQSPLFMEFIEDDFKAKGKPITEYVELDFANRHLGGGALGSGIAQEEVAFTKHPEYIVGSLITQAMNKDEALIIIGARMFANAKGTLDQFQFTGAVEEAAMKQIDPIYGFVKHTIIAVDALESSDNKKIQYEPEGIYRDTMKAFAGMKKNQYQPDAGVIGGNWGSGVFGLDWRIKLMQQWIAASEAERSIFVYSNPKDTKNNTHVQKSAAIAVLNKLAAKNTVNVGEVYNKFVELVKSDTSAGKTNWWIQFEKWSDAK